MIISKINILFFILFVSILSVVTQCIAASAHIREKHRGSAERTKDGAYSARDSDHYVDGEHHQEFDHEAILGSVKQAEEFDKLSSSESKRRLGILLLKMDLNNDKFIERNELKAWILRSFNMLSDEESQDRLEDADSDEDGRVSWSEVLQDMYGSDSDDLSVDDKLVSDDKELFEAADTNQDGFLDKEEFKAYTHPEETPKMFPILLKQALDEKDTDQDGYINFQEFLGNRARDEDKEWLIVEKEKFDHEHDKNHDGLLEKDEIMSWLVPSNDEIATDEVDHLFAAADDDHDNRLSFEEILEHHMVFVGSEATDYGDHLKDIERFQDEL